MKPRAKHLGYSAFALLAAYISWADQPPNFTVIKRPLAPDHFRADQPLPNGVITWNTGTKIVDAIEGQAFARFEFCFTNVSLTAVTILSVQPSCGCTTVELPPVPWKIPAGSTGQIHVKVNLAGKSGTIFKSVNVTTDKGVRILTLSVNMVSPRGPKMTDAQRAAGIAMASADRQAVFKSGCSSCHLKNVEAAYGRPLYEAACAICHDANARATMTPDLHHLPVTTDLQFWRSWIASGKPGTLMPAFGSSQGGPLSDMQISSLSVYLNATISSHVSPPLAKISISSHMR